MSNVMTREDILNEAKKCVCEDRESQYGSPENSFNRIAAFWTVYLGYEISPEDVGTMMTLLKIARVAGGKLKADSYIDACGYMACAGEIAMRQEG